MYCIVLFGLTTTKLISTLLQEGIQQNADFCSSLAAGAHDVLLLWLQSLLNAAVWLFFSAKTFDHTTPLLCELHWLKVPCRASRVSVVYVDRTSRGTVNQNEDKVRPWCGLPLDRSSRTAKEQNRTGGGVKFPIAHWALWLKQAPRCSI